MANPKQNETHQTPPPDEPVHPTEDQLDEEIEESFPASDPPSSSVPTTPGAPPA